MGKDSFCSNADENMACFDLKGDCDDKETVDDDKVEVQNMTNNFMKHFFCSSPGGLEW